MPLGTLVALVALSMETTTSTETNVSVGITIEVLMSSGTAKSQLDSAISILSAIYEDGAAAYWKANRQQVLSAFGSVRTKSADGAATSRGVDFGSASLSKVLKHLSSPKREAALLSAAWAMSSALALK